MHNIGLGRRVACKFQITANRICGVLPFSLGLVEVPFNWTESL